MVEFKQVTAACVATLISATGPSIGSAALPEAQAASCLPNVNLVTKAPLSTYGLPGGASVRIWDTGHSANALNEVRVAAVTIPRGTLTPGAVTPPPP